MAATLETVVKIETNLGTGEALTFAGLSDFKDHLGFGLGSWRGQAITNVRVHSECLTGDVFGSARCDCGPQLHEAMRRFDRIGGLILYLRQEGRGIGLRNKMKAYKLQDEGLDTYEANRRLGFEPDLRDFGVAAEMLKALGISKIYLYTNNPRKAEGLAEHGIEVVDRIFTGTHIGSHNHRYLRAKREHGGHDGLSFEDPTTSNE